MSRATLLAVNREAGDAHACVVATFGFIPGAKVGEVDKNGTVVHVLEVKVMAVATVVGLQLVEPKTYYTVIRVEAAQRLIGKLRSIAQTAQPQSAGSSRRVPWSARIRGCQLTAMFALDRTGKRSIGNAGAGLAQR